LLQAVVLKPSAPVNTAAHLADGCATLAGLEVHKLSGIPALHRTGSIRLGSATWAARLPDETSAPV